LDRSTEQRLLDSINSPADLRRLNQKQLPVLAKEIRERILETTAQNGGHLASNLGVVELTLALHYVFDTPADRLIWDVGHQCYAHKLLTGRQQQFSTLRCPGGLSGFCRREESAYDCFTTGHSSNSISLALGMAAARDAQGGQEHIVAVIGDGALTGGMAMEALDQAGDLQANLIVVLNDNGMSIGGNVGAMSSYLSRFRANPAYDALKRRVKNFFSHIPLLGQPLINIFSTVKNSLKSALVPGMLFEDLGFVYLGPIDGHDLHELIDILDGAREVGKPTLVHVKTVKGKGYAPAERSPEIFHGLGRFDAASGIPLNDDCKGSYTEIMGDALVRLASVDPDIVAITAAMTHGTGLDRFKERFPERFYDVAIAEQHAVSFAAGLASHGKKPLVAIYSTFLQRAYDQIIIDVCLQNLPVVFAVDRAGLVGCDGYSHQGLFDLAYLRSVPKLTVMAPADGREFRVMLAEAFAYGKPVAIRYPKCHAGELPGLPRPLEYGRSVQLKDGGDLAFIAIGSMVQPALKAAELLEREGIRARVVNARFIAPLDKEALLRAVRECRGRLISVEENVISGGFGAACAEALSGVSAELVMAALPSEFQPQGRRGDQLAALGLNGPGLAALAVRRWFPERRAEHA